MKTRTCIFIFIILNFGSLALAYSSKSLNVNSFVLSSDTAAIRKLNDSARTYVYRNTSKSITFAKQALNQAVQIKNSIGQADALINLAKAYYINGVYNVSLRYGTQLGVLSKKINYGYGKAFSVNNGGLIFLSQDDFRGALNEFNTALQINQAYKNLKPQASNYFNIALCYLNLNLLSEGERALQKSIEISKKVGDSTLLIMATNRLGDIAYQQKRYQKSIVEFKLAIKENTLKNDWEYTYSYTGMALSLFEIGSYQEAVSEAERGLSYAKKLNAHWDLQRASEILHRSYVALGDYKSAYVYFKLDKLYSDSLYSEKKEKEINKLQLRQKQIENGDLQHTLKIKQQQNQLSKLVIVVIGSLIFFLVIILLVIYRKNIDIARQKDKIVAQNKDLSDLNHSKDQLFSVIGHDLRSPIVSLVQTVDLLRSQHLTAEETQMILDNFFEKLTATATMLDNLLLWANRQKTDLSAQKIDFSVPELVNQLLLLLNFQAKEKGVRIDHQVLNDAFAFADINHVRIILQNLISNAIKFTPTGGQIFVHYFVKNKKVGVVIKDTGVGIANEKLNNLFKVVGKEISTYGTANEKGIGIGLMLVKKYANENNAEIIVNSDEHGTEFVIVFDAADKNRSN